MSEMGAEIVNDVENFGGKPSQGTYEVHGTIICGRGKPQIECRAPTDVNVR